MLLNINDEIKILIDQSLITFFKNDDTKEALIILTDKGEKIARDLGYINESVNSRQLKIFLSKTNWLDSLK